tara:strand:- start:1563 stop:5267 length:3705 start_codon:yes stop_codon:yes gene_type:complete
MRILTFLIVFAAAFQSTAAKQEPPVIMGYQWAHDKFQELMQEHGAPQPIARKQLQIAPQSGDIKSFWTMNVANNQPTQIQATLEHIGKHCYIYLELEQEDRVSKETIQKLADQFDNQIYETNHKFFGSEASPGIDFDKRITLLLLDIQDGWEPGRGYVAGYFSPLDTYSTELWDYSNEREMFYLDVFPGDPKRPDYLGILAHEFQHMIHHNYDKREKLWLNEAMSQIAFYVNNYGHAPQILAFIQQPDTQLDEFNNGLDDYGNVYLFMYYLLSKKLGDMDTVAKVFREIVQSQKQSIESIDEVLAANGFDFTINEIIPDFLVANYVNDWNIAEGQFGYDKTLPMQVQPTSVYAFDALPESMEGKVNQRGADFIRMTPRIASEPINPTLVDKIKIFAEFPGMVSWNINDGQLPPQAYIPNQAVIEGQYVKMPTTTDENGRHFVEVGPFRGAGVRVTKVNYTLKSEIAELKGMIPVYSFQTLAKSTVSSVTVNFNGQNKGWVGKDKRFLLKKFLRFSDGKKVVSDVALDSKNDASWTEDLAGVEEFTLIPTSTLGGELKYTVEFKTSKSASLSLLDEWASNEKLFMKKLMQYPGLLDTLQKEFLNLEEDTRMEIAPEFRQFLRNYQFRLFNSVSNPELMEEFSVGLGAETIQADDKDDAHDNIDYLVSKAREQTHNLSHLQIDPKIIEGQILKIWKLLEIARGFPHLPLPDGLAFKDYDVSQLENILDDWQQRGDDKFKEPLRRMALAQTVILSTYNEGLVMAEDTAVCILDLVRFFFSARETASSLLKPIISKGGIIGRLGEKVLKKIQAKIIQILNKVVSLISVKLRPPYNTIVPIATSVITGIYANVKDINVEYDHEDALKLFAVKTAGKYAMMSFPRVGLVDVGQKNVTYLADRAKEMETSYDIDVAQDAVREVLAPILTEINTVHAQTLKKRQYVQIAKWVTQLAGLTSVIDPTNISKVVAILSTATGTGLLGHSIYNSTRTLYGIPGKVPAGINAAFTPYEESAISRETMSGINQVHNIVILQERTERAHQSFVDQLATFEGAISLNNQDHLQVLEKYMRSEESYEAILTDQEMAILATQEDSDETILEMGENSLLRSELEVQLLLNNQAEVRKLATEIKGREKKLMRKLRNLPSRVRGKSIVGVREVSRTVSGSNFSLKINIRSMGRIGQANLKVYAEGVQLEEDSFQVDSKTRFLTIKGKKLTDRMTTLHLVLETQTGIAGYPTILNL